MATDNTEPRNRLIVFYTAMSVLSLVALSFVFNSYFTTVSEAEVYRKVLARKSEELSRLREAESRTLSSGPLPIQAAMAKVVQVPRESLTDISPNPSVDADPLKGWMKLPQPVDFHPRAPGEEAPALPDEDAGALTNDAGTQVTPEQNDAGATAEPSTQAENPTNTANAQPSQPAAQGAMNDGGTH